MSTVIPKELVFFYEGDVVCLKQDIPNKPKMVVLKIKKSRLTKESEKPVLLGVSCFWFTVDGLYQEQSFNTKDLEKVTKNA